VGSVRAEALKLRRRPANWLVIAIGVFAIIVLIYLLQYLRLHNSGQRLSPSEVSLLKLRLYPPGFLQSVLRNLNQLFHVLALVLGALTTGSEFGWGTWKTLFTQGPTRVAVVISKLGVLTGAVLLFTFLLFAFSAGSSYISAVIDAEPVRWPVTADIAQAAGAASLIMLLWAMFGAALGALLRQPTLALGLGIVYVIADSIAWGFLATVPGARPMLRILPGANATVLQAVLVPRQNSFLLGELLDISTAHAAAVTGLYAFVCLVVAALVIRHRDVI
jgi:ABC-2 type transport system permease protein